MYIKVDTISKAVESGDAKLLAVFLFFKGKYSNSAFYKWSCKSISIKMGVSRGFVRKYVPEFIARGWCRVEGEALIFNKTIGLYEAKFPKTVNINTQGKVKDILAELFLAVLKNKADHFEYLRECWKNQIKESAQSVAHYKEIKKKCKGKRIELGAPSGFVCSISRIAEYFNTSVSSASRTMKALKTKGRITPIQRTESMGNVQTAPGLNRSLSWGEGLYVTKYGTIKKRLANQYNFHE